MGEGVSLPLFPTPYALIPRKRHGWLATMPIPSFIRGPILEVVHEAHELLDGFLVGFLALLRRRQLGIAQDARLGIAARPRNQRGRSGAEEIDPVERIVLVVEADRAA